jgi:hypothetical protein
MTKHLLHALTNNIKLAALATTFMLVSCSSSINIKDYVEKNSAFSLTINSKDTATGFTKSSQTKIIVGSDKYLKLISWLDKNENGWHTTPASYISTILVTQQNSFRLLYKKGDNGVVIGLKDKQYSKTIKKGELDFLTP